MSKFLPIESFKQRTTYSLLPFTFARLAGDEYLVTNMVGESAVMQRAFITDLVNQKLVEGSPDFGRARALHLIRMPGESAPVELLALKNRTRIRHLPNFTNLHILVVSLRCDHSCPYCQVSRQSEDKARFDMSAETAQKALDLIFQSPARNLKIEFQGGEPLLNFNLIRDVVLNAERRAAASSRNVEFVIATTLSLLRDDILDFCAEHEIYLSTSLDGPEDLHNRNRPRPGRDSYQRFVAGLSKARDVLGRDRVHALMTTTKASLGRVREIIDEYVALQFNSIFLRPISPYGFAMRTRQFDAYDVEEWMDFYKEGLSYILELNKSGTRFSEIYSSIVLQKMLTFDDPGYVDLMNPAGIGIAAAVYNYDGMVYASDEARMLAEMGDRKFCLGSMHELDYHELFGADALIDPLDESFTLSSPMCADCAFEPYCGADPVFHYGMYGDVAARKAESAFCQRNMGVFRHLLQLRSDPATDKILRSWVFDEC